MDTNLQGWDVDTADKEKIRMTGMEKEAERVRARATRQLAIASGSTGAKTTMTEAVVEVTAVAGGVDTGAVTTVMTVMVVTAMTMTRLSL